MAVEVLMELTNCVNAEDFLDFTRLAFEANEAAYNLMYGLALTAQQLPVRFQSTPYYAVVHENGHLQAAALMTPPHNLIVYASDAGVARPAFDLIANDLRHAQWPVPGVLGPSRAARDFAQAWKALTTQGVSLTMRERLYELRQVIPPAQPAGGMRLATMADLDLASEWLHEFHLEATTFETTTLEEDRQTARHKIEDGNFFLWIDREPVALAGKARPTPHGQCVGPVYTPPRFRRRGYATALTAALSQSILDTGKQFSVLFTNLANPISNSIYMKIGYSPVCDFEMYSFQSL